MYKRKGVVANRHPLKHMSVRRNTTPVIFSGKRDLGAKLELVLARLKKSVIIFAGSTGVQMKLVFFRVIARVFFCPDSRYMGLPLEKRIADTARRGGDCYN
ncbi:MAG: hypothetical protein UW75_C0030G0002 [Parcubacteria group bacterium GW2011_GWF2_44_8]|nr:MAG: hypothetical protein UW75_C0030G0002 [Parcubacteria group bacterium GW2011_GWF2_44_8]